MEDSFTLSFLASFWEFGFKSKNRDIRGIMLGLFKEKEKNKEWHSSDEFINTLKSSKTMRRSYVNDLYNFYEHSYVSFCMMADKEPNIWKKTVMPTLKELGIDDDLEEEHLLDRTNYETFFGNDNECAFIKVNKYPAGIGTSVIVTSVNKCFEILNTLSNIAITSINEGNRIHSNFYFDDVTTSFNLYINHPDLWEQMDSMGAKISLRDSSYDHEFDLNLVTPSKEYLITITKGQQQQTVLIKINKDIFSYNGGCYVEAELLKNNG